MVERGGRNSYHQKLEQYDSNRVSEESFEEKLLGSEVIFQKQTSLREVVKHEGNDPVGLLDAPVNFEARELGDSLVYIVSFLPNQASLGDKRLIRLLSGAKPIRQMGAQDKNAITEDWRILQEQEREGNTYHKWLYDDHASGNSFIKDQFKEVETNHFPQFWQAIMSSYNEDTNTILHGLFTKIMSEGKAQARYGLDFLIADHDRFLKVVNSVWEYKAHFAKLLSNKFGMNNSDAFQLFHDRGAQSFIFMMRSHGEIQELIRDFYNQLDDKEKRSLLYTTVSLYNFPACEGTILVDENGDLHDMYDGRFTSSTPDRFGIRKFTSDQVEITEGEAYLRVSFVRDERTGYRKPKIVGKYIPAQEDEIVPVIVWERDKNTGRAEYFCGRIAEELISAFPHLFSHNHDTLVGQLVAAGYSYDLRRKLPSRLALRKRGGEQEMREGQSPVWVKIYDKMFLKASPVILGFEALALENNVI